MELSRPAPPAAGEKFRILVVEDELHIARLLQINLEKAGFSCTHAGDGDAALATFRTFVPHLVLLDIMLPKRSGKEVLVKIRESSAVPVVMLTAMSTEDDEMTGFKLGADDYITKPFNPRLMVARVISHLRRAYRYDPAPAQETEPVAPPGWVTCDACRYMGPRERFESYDSEGRKTLRCPHCKDRDRLTFSLG
ncbi:MAG TPA: response regulator transcription factor [Abditibacteriaceae bacterium]|jgi:DNA-binding response OmpR family regulator